jgi:hypothetical protein
LVLENSLKYDIYSDINGLDVLSELKMLKEILQTKTSSALEILDYIIKLIFFFQILVLLIEFYW